MSSEAMLSRHPTGPMVRVETLAQIADEQHQVLALELNAGLRNFDVFDLDAAWIPEFAQHGWLVDLEDLRPNLERDALPGPLQTAVWRGKLWAAPYVTNAGILYYRYYKSDLVSKPPTTWEDLIDIGRRVGEQNGIASFVADGKQYEGLVIQYLVYFWDLGGEVFGHATPEWVTIDAEMQQQSFAAYTGNKDPEAAVEDLRNFLLATVTGG